jgi:hypothetical protein
MASSEVKAFVIRNVVGLGCRIYKFKDKEKAYDEYALHARKLGSARDSGKKLFFSVVLVIVNARGEWRIRHIAD